MTDPRDDLLTTLAAVALATRDVLPSQVSPLIESVQRTREPDLDWAAGIALHHIVSAGILTEDILALVRQVRVRAIADALGAIDEGSDWSVCTLTGDEHEEQSGLDSEFWFVASLDSP